MKGRCKWFNDKKGYGFIEPDEGADVFVHHSEIDGHGRRTLIDGERVEFDVIDGPKGPSAKRVKRTSAARV